MFVAAAYQSGRCPDSLGSLLDYLRSNALRIWQVRVRVNPCDCGLTQRVYVDQLWCAGNNSLAGAGPFLSRSGISGPRIEKLDQDSGSGVLVLGLGGWGVCCKGGGACE